MALWQRAHANASPQEEQVPNVSGFDYDVLDDLMPESNMPIEYFRPKTSVIRAGVGDETEDAPVTARRTQPQDLRMEMLQRITSIIAWGRSGGDQGQAVRIRTRNSPNLHNAPLSGGDVKPRLITEEKLLELGFVDAMGNPFNPAGTRKNIVSHRCTCTHQL